jgi:AsmA-like C-terminal region
VAVWASLTVSHTLSEFVAPASPPGDPPGWRARLWRLWLKWAALGVVCLFLGDTGISFLIQHTGLKRRLTSRIEVAFGRPVEVRGYSFSLWTGPELEAYSVRVAEDPRFGHEYFLRAESMTLRLRIGSLLFGHLRLGTISLSRPSLNLVRNTDGDWNLAEWLPRPSVAGRRGPRASAASQAGPAPPFDEIEVDEGRINFKHGDDKVPFAFVNVNGRVQTDGPGRWQLDLVAAPMRAATIVEQPGLLHLVGSLGGTSSRLRPATLQVDWSDASIPDVLRLACDRDYGLRGTLGLTVSARTQGESWLLNGNASLAQVHFWNLPLRPDNPSLNLVAAGRLDASGSRLELTQARIEAPHSKVAVTGALDWTHPGPELADLLVLPPGAGKLRRQRAQARKPPGTELHVVSNAVSLSDLLDWARAFHSGIAEGISLEGNGRVDADLDGWPPRLRNATFDLPRAALAVPRFPAPVRIGPVVVRYDADRGITLPPATLTVGGAANLFRIDGSATPAGDFALRVRGSTANVHDIVDVANRLGWNLARGWNIGGPARCDLRWEGSRLPWHASLAGSVDWGTASDGVSFGAPFLNRPVEQIRARADLHPGLTRVTLSSARAFGARWSGTLDHDLSDGWRFSVSGDSLSAADLDRWLDPRWRESFLDRMLPFLSFRAPASAALDSLRASGRVALESFTLAPIEVQHLRGNLKLDGRRLEFVDVSGQLDGGQISGSLQAYLDAVPSYETTLDISNVALRTFSADFPSLANVFSGDASAKVRFNMRGTSRSDLLNSLECRGTAVAKDFSARRINLPVATTPSPTEPDSLDSSSFPEASAAFTCSSGSIHLQDLTLSGVGTSWDGTGSADFGGRLDLHLQSIPDAAETRVAKLARDGDGQPSPDGAGIEYRIAGTLDSPHISRAAVPPRASADKP